jgi:hypothetical protein
LNSAIINAIHSRYKKIPWNIYLYPLSFGLCGGLLAITRDDTLPIILGMTGFILLNSIMNQTKKISAPKISSKKLLALFSVVTFFSFATPVLLIAGINLKTYGYFGINDYSQGSFAKAIVAWSNVENGRDSRAGVYISEAQRQSVYKISPSAKLLEKGLESGPGQGWKAPMCQTVGVCDEFGAAWLPFAMRESAIMTGRIKKESDFQDFFNKIYSDIEKSCEKRLLTCDNYSVSTGILTFPQAIRADFLAHSFNFGKSLLNGEQSKNFTTFINQLQPSELVSEWKNGTGLSVNQNPFDSTPREFTRKSILVFKEIYNLFLYFISMLGTIGILLTWRRQVNFEIKLLLMSLTSSILLFIGLYGIISASWGFLAFPWTYGAPIQPIYLIVTIFANLIFLENVQFKNMKIQTKKFKVRPLFSK